MGCLSPPVTDLRLATPKVSSPSHAPTMLYPAPGLEGMLDVKDAVLPASRLLSVLRDSPGADETALAPHSEMTRAGRGTRLLMASGNSTGSDGRGHSPCGGSSVCSVFPAWKQRGELSLAVALHPMGSVLP